MKILVVGCGGVGGWLIDEIASQVNSGQLEFDEVIDISDSDIVELNQMLYQNFRESEIGTNKAVALSRRFNKELGVEVFGGVRERITTPSQLEGYDFFVLCVDNEKTREFIIRYCHEHGKEFLDLRATGRRVFAMPKLRTLEENLKFVDGSDTNEYSCQDREDLENGRIQLGHKIVAVIGTQMLLNHQRGHGNRTISMMV